MRVGYYPGCSLVGSSRDFGESVAAVAGALEVELAEVPGWNCCGASSAHALDHLLALALPASVLASAARAGLGEVLAPCASCYYRLVSAQRELAGSEQLRRRVERVIDMPVGAPVKVLNVLEWLERCVDLITPKVKQPFARTVACYYGCLLVRPAKVIEFDRSEDPVSMDQLVARVGGKTVEWGFKTECCGAALSIPRTPTVGQLGARIVRNAAGSGAEAIVVACPMCHSNLDMRRGAIEEALGTSVDLPVLFITQVVGLALGISERALGLQRHFVEVRWPGRTPTATASASGGAAPVR